MKKLYKHGVLMTALLAASSIPLPARAASSDIQARLVVRDQCVLAQKKFAAEARPAGDKEAAFVAAILASIAGSLAQSAVSGLAGAIDRASSEMTFKATGIDRFDHGRIVIDAENKTAPYAYRDQPKCAIIAVPDEIDGKPAKNAIPFENIGEAKGVKEVFPSADTAAFTDMLKKEFGLQHVPLAYAEVAILPSEDDLRIEPIAVWYRKAMPGAPASKAQRAELQVALATAGYSATGDALGSVYAFARMQLPPMRPGDYLTHEALRFANLISHASRPAREADKAAAAGYNLAHAKAITAKEELAGAEAQLALARAELADKNTAVNRLAVEARDKAFGKAREAVEKADYARSQTPPDGDPDLFEKGKTNARVAFIVIRDENKFGKAIAKALGAQAEAVGTAVKNQLTPAPAWAATDTAYVTAQAGLDSAMATLDAAVREGDPLKIAAAEAAVRVAKAKLNEAAVGADRLPPFPDIAG